MRIVVNPDFELHRGQGEFHQGRFVECFESPSRLHHILAALDERGYSTTHEPVDHGLEPILRVHDADYVEFLRTIHDRWTAAGNEGDVMPYLWPVPGLRRLEHDNLNAVVGSYAFSSDTPIMSGTWAASYGGVQTTLTALEHCTEGAFALTRPPGHHAHARYYGGYCYLNNVAIAAQAAIDADRRRVCILDVDFHHGNGTQDIFYERSDVLTISLHGDPRDNFPYFLGYSDERGSGAGEGKNINVPLSNGTTFSRWLDELLAVVPTIVDHGTELLIVALGVDTYAGDPISSFAFQTDDYLELGKNIAGLELPTLFVMEGGYAVEPLGTNVVNVLEGFSGR